MRSVAHVLGPSMGGTRRHVRYLAGHPPEGFRTLGVWGPPGLGEYFGPLPYHPVGRLWLAGAPPGADIVHAHGLTPAALRRGATPFVRTVHIDISTQGRPGRSHLVRLAARVVASRADAIIAVSERVARSFPGAHVVPPAVDDLPPPARSRAEVRESIGTRPDAVVVMTAARLHPDKNLGAFVAACAASGAEGWICGEGPGRGDLEESVRGTGVRLLGYRADIPDLLGAADVFALPSAGEAYGIAVVEALQAGIPVVATDAGAMRELVGDAGLVVEAGDDGAFLSAVKELVGDAARRTALAVRARERTFPSPSELVERVGAVYRGVLR